MSIEQTLRETGVLALELEPPPIFEETTPLARVLEGMRTARQGYALLTRADDLSGIFTERDLVQRVLTEGVVGEQDLERPVSECMTRDPYSVTEDTPISAVIECMQQHGFRHVVVLEESGSILGCVRHSDVITFLAQFHAAQILNLPPNPEQVALSPEGA